jgi:S-adenosylmethionine synthetase
MKLFTSEAVTQGHPDKIADQISDALLDAIIEKDPEARVALETLVTTGQVHVAGEVTTSAWVDATKIIRDLINQIGYTDSKLGFDGNSVGINLAIGSQSPDIAMGVDRSFEARSMRKGDVSETYDLQGAGDQGIMFGFATDETQELMPLPITLAHQLAHRLTTARTSGFIDYLRPDGKTQVTISYDLKGNPIGVETILISAQHDPDVDHREMTYDLHQAVIQPVLNKYPNLDTENTRIIINPTGRFVIGGPQGDAGVTGRKIIVDSYGGAARHGGGAFSGKDPSKVDRSAAYAARWVAKHVVASKLAKRCEIQLAYAIGTAQPLAIYVETFGTGVVPDSLIADAISKTFDLRPAAIIDQLDLKKPIYLQTATGGHFGRSEFSWEQTPKIIQLLNQINYPHATLGNPHD